MKISYRWLSQYIHLPELPEQVGQWLTSTGLEVENIELYESIKGGLNGLVVGQIITCAKHPNADKLSVTTVDVGTEKPLSIVCGAPNVAAGQKVLVALPGATVHPTQGEPFTIKVTKIRGEHSEGMICAEDEVGLGSSHAGIMILDEAAIIGIPAADYFKVQTDHVFEIGLTPNRADAASHVGVARDLKALLNRPLQLPSVDSVATKPTSQRKIEVHVENTVACPRYSGVTLSHITVKPSPAWLQQRLRAIGLSPINNVVDVTNFVCHELGQPLHAFDADKIVGGTVRVKTLPAGTPFITLDNQKRTLTADDLMICDGNDAPMCIAGVFGGSHSGISENTTVIFLESAHFSAAYTRKSSQHHLLKTDASFRFERGTDPNITIYALKRAMQLLAEVAGAQPASEIIDIYPYPVPHREVRVKHEFVNRLIGKNIEPEKYLRILQQLDMEIIHRDAYGFTAAVPPYRVDVTQPADVVEEILRLYGFNNIELEEDAGTDYLAHFPEKSKHTFKRILGEHLAANGFFEILTNSLTRAAYRQKYLPGTEDQTVEILNKLSEEQGILRPHMLFTCLEVCAHNINRRQKDLKLFEFGTVYEKQAGHYHEQERLALVMTGQREAESWQHPSTPVSYHDLAQRVAHVLQKSALRDVTEERASNPLLDYGMQLRQGKTVAGMMGKVKASIQKDFGIKQDVFYADLDFGRLFSASQPAFEATEIPRFPEVRRDLSLVIDQHLTFADIRQLIEQTEKSLIKEVITFDVYQGDKIPAEKKAYALGFILQDDNKTLTDGEVDRVMQKLMAAFEQKMKAVIRK